MTWVNFRCPRQLSARGVIDMHADLHRTMSNMTPDMRRNMTRYGLEDAQINLAWAPSHLHPAKDLRDLSPWLDSIGADLFGATTFQITEEMIDLAEAMLGTTPNYQDIQEQELPSASGFMWLDRPIPRPSVEDEPGQEPLMMHAVSWMVIPSVPIDIRVMEREEGDPLHIEGQPEEYPDREIRKEPVATVYVPAVRIREWGWNDDPGIEPRPLHLMGQSMVILTEHVHTSLTELHLIHMIWILMGMEIVAHTWVSADRAGRRRAANLRQHDVTVITLRRPAHGEPTGEHRHVDWTCTWLVRGHYRYPACDLCGKRRGKHGQQGDECPGYQIPAGRYRTWIHPYIKGPDGMPLRASDVLYKLSR